METDQHEHSMHQRRLLWAMAVVCGLSMTLTSCEWWNKVKIRPGATYEVAVTNLERTFRTGAEGVQLETTPGTDPSTSGADAPDPAQVLLEFKNKWLTKKRPEARVVIRNLSREVYRIARKKYDVEDYPAAVRAGDLAKNLASALDEENRLARDLVQEATKEVNRPIFRVIGTSRVSGIEYAWFEIPPGGETYQVRVGEEFPQKGEYKLLELIDDPRIVVLKYQPTNKTYEEKYREISPEVLQGIRTHRPQSLSETADRQEVD